MTTRIYTFAITGRISVSDTDLKAALLGMEFVPDPAADVDVTDELRLAIHESVLGITEDLSPEDRLRVFLSAGPLARARRDVVESIQRRLPTAEVEAQGLDVDVTYTSQS